jgi:hypothetical protein
MVTGVSRHSISRYETGRTESLPFVEIVKIGSALGLTPNDLAVLANLLPSSEGLREHGPRERLVLLCSASTVGLDEEQVEDLITVLEIGLAFVRRRRRPRTVPHDLLRRLGIEHE